jgi:exopolysaccharide biosynthesis WecB/TagA/CpsF family protein
MLNIIKEKGTDSIEVEGGISTFLNPYSYLVLRKQKNMLNEFDHIYIDGEYLCKFLRMFDLINVNRRSFDNTSLAPIIFERSLIRNESVAIIGSDESSIEKFQQYLNEKYVGIDLIYARNGYFNSEADLEDAINELINLQPKIVVVGMGAVKQEEFLLKLKIAGWYGTGYTCGGYIHQTASKGEKYYPSWINKYNLRFIYRIYDEPKLFKRYSVDYMLFVFCFLIDIFKFEKKIGDEL